MIHNIEAVYKILRQDERLLSTEGEILKNKVYELAMKMDSILIKSLASNENTKEMFFTEVDGILVFDKTEFGWIIDSKDFLPDSYTSFKNDIMLVDTQGNSISGSNNVVLSFPFKDCILEVDSTEADEKREEVFFNEILAKSDIDTLLAPKVLTNGIRHSKDKKEKAVEITNDDNLIIKGNNLIAINSLLPSYEGQIKLMYWDILYNTENDLVPYNDSFKHSSWLVMMKNRLKDAYNLLSEDGVIFIQSDDNEIHYLKVLMDEIFNRNNFINTITVKTKIGGVSGSSEGKSFKDATEFINVYAKNKSVVMFNPAHQFTPLYEYVQSYIEEGKSWKYTSVITELSGKKEFKKLGEYTLYTYENFKSKSIKAFAKEKGITDEEVYKNYNNKIFRTTNAQSSVRQTVIEETSRNSAQIVSIEYVPIKGKNKGKMIEIFYKDPARNMLMMLSDMVKEVNGEPYYAEKPNTLWDDIQYNNLAREGGVNLPFGKKPEMLIKRIIEVATDENDIILDAYFGTGTTGAVALKTGRKFIGIEQLDKHYDMAIERLTNVVNGDKTGISKEYEWNGGGSFVSVELKTLSNQLIDRIRVSTEAELSGIYNEISESPFLNYKAEIYKLKEAETKFESLTEDEKRRILIELIDKNTLYVNYADMDDASYGITEDEKALSTSFYTK